MWKPKDPEFIDLARTGKNEWWSYLLGLLVVLGSGFGGGYVGKLALRAWDDCYSSFCSSHGPVCGAYWYIYWLIAYPTFFQKLTMLVSAFVVIRVLHRRQCLSLITTSDHFNRKYLTQGFSLYFFLGTVAIMAEHLFSSGPRITLPRISGTAVTILVGIIVSAVAEEVLFRGYILQGLGLLIRNRVLLASVNGLLFAVVHAGAPQATTPYLILVLESGFFFAFITLKSNGLELAIGAHIADNLVADINRYCTQLQPVHFAISIPVCAMIFYFTVFRPSRRGR